MKHAYFHRALRARRSIRYPEMHVAAITRAFNNYGAAFYERVWNGRIVCMDNLQTQNTLYENRMLAAKVEEFSMRALKTIELAFACKETELLLQ